MSISFETIRTGKKYYLKNYGEEFRFEVLDIQADGDFKVKDLLTLEIYYINDLIRFGKGEDYEFWQIG